MSMLFGNSHGRKKESQVKTEHKNDIKTYDGNRNENKVKTTRTKKNKYNDEIVENVEHHRNNNRFTESDSDESSPTTSREIVRKYRLILAISWVVFISCVSGVLIFLLIYYYFPPNSPAPAPAPAPALAPSCQTTPAWGEEDGVYVYNTFSGGYNDINVGSYVYPCVKNNSINIIYVDACNPFVLIYNNNGNEYCHKCFEYCNGENLAPVYPGGKYCVSGFQLQATSGYTVQLKYARYCYGAFFSTCTFVSSAGSMSFCVV